MVCKVLGVGRWDLYYLNVWQEEMTDQLLLFMEDQSEASFSKDCHRNFTFVFNEGNFCYISYQDFSCTGLEEGSVETRRGRAGKAEKRARETKEKVK